MRIYVIGFMVGVMGLVAVNQLRAEEVLLSARTGAADTRPIADAAAIDYYDGTSVIIN